MPRIRVLPDPLVNRIAAGEVVERPASVLKELVENSLDAGAMRLELELAEGGRRLVRVSDDGCGMDADDALLALERHATSKIADVADLEHLTTLGFRGEALPSIAAVSRFSLVTSPDPASGGVRLTVEGGRILGVEPAARPRGTTVEVCDLFFNTPARRKFLSAPETELRHAQELLWAAAMARPDVAFRLRHGARTLVEVAPTADPAERLRGLLGRAERPIHHFEADGGGVRVWGLLAAGAGAGRAALTLLVNGRAVRDRLLVGAALRALREGGAALGGSRLVLFLEVAPDQVDVNVHPAKAEVRFARAGAVFSVVDRAVRRGVAASQGRVDVRRLDLPTPGDSTSPAVSGYGELLRERNRVAAPLFAHPAYGEPTPAAAVASPEEVGPMAPVPESGPRPRSGARPRAADTPFGRLIGQYRDSFLLLEDDWGLAIVDQHVAHERVLYDRIRRRLAGESAPSQRLLTPLVVEVGEVLAAALPRVADLLERVGLEADLFGPDTVRLSAVPPELTGGDAADLVRELLDRATSLDGLPEQVAEALADELAAALSCRGAIKVNHPLAPEAQRALLADLEHTTNPYRCPHGRPIVLRLSQEEMERRLGRR